jgi:hypothetical protein
MPVKATSPESRLPASASYRTQSRSMSTEAGYRCTSPGPARSWPPRSAPSFDGDPLTEPAARDGAVRDYRAHLQTVAKRQPLHPATLGKQLSALGITTLHARTATIRQLVLQAPAPVVAGMLGYHHETTTKLATDAGSPWSKYAPGDHTRSQP